MKCEKCDEIILDNAVYEFRGKKLCDDCYIDLMIGIPEIDFSKLPPLLQSQFLKVKNGWHRDRPNRHHYLKFPKL